MWVDCFVLDGVASGAIWIDMHLSGVDVLVSAPQKGWSGSPCCAFVMLSERACGAMDGTTSTSFAADLKKWLQVMQAYEGGGQTYHLTLPTDALARTRDAMFETRACGFETLRSRQIDLGRKVCSLLAGKGLPSVAAEALSGAGRDRQLHRRRRAAHWQGLRWGRVCRLPAGVPLRCGEAADFKTFRIGLFGLDKLNNVDRTVGSLDAALGRILGVDPQGTSA